MKDIRKIRTALGFNQTEMADRLGISQSYLSRLESGASKLDKRTELAVVAVEAAAAAENAPVAKRA